MPMPLSLRTGGRRTSSSSSSTARTRHAHSPDRDSQRLPHGLAHAALVQARAQLRDGRGWERRPGALKRREVADGATVPRDKAGRADDDTRARRRELARVAAKQRPSVAERGGCQALLRVAHLSRFDTSWLRRCASPKTLSSCPTPLRSIASCTERAVFTSASLGASVAPLALGSGTVFEVPLPRSTPRAARTSAVDPVATRPPVPQTHAAHSEPRARAHASYLPPAWQRTACRR
jgi:hypothetical protein